MPSLPTRRLRTRRNLAAAPFHVLLIDDDPSTLMRMRDWLVSARYRVSCHVGRRNLEAAIGETMPDLIVIDVLMPGLSGADVVELLATHPATSNTPVLLRSPMHVKVLQRMIPIGQALGVIESGAERTAFLGTVQAFANCIKLRTLLRTPHTSGTHRIMTLRDELPEEEKTGSDKK